MYYFLNFYSTEQKIQINMAFSNPLDVWSVFPSFNSRMVCGEKDK